MNSGDRKFEENWKRAFADAESDVNPSVWMNIESKLARAENGAMKKRILFFQWLAAASVVFALVAGSVLLLQNNVDKHPGFAFDNTKSRQANGTNDSSNNIMTNENVETSRNLRLSTERTADSRGLRTEENSSTSSIGHSKRLAHQPPKADTRDAKRVSAGSEKSTDSSAGMGSLQSDTGDQSVGVALVPPQAGYSATPMEASPTQAVANESKNNGLPTGLNERMNEIEIAKLSSDSTSFIKSPIKIAENKPASEPSAKADKKEERDENWWASVNGSTGSYTSGGIATPSPAFLTSIGGLNSLNSPPVTTTTTARVGITFSYGVNVGKRISQRWMVISGVGYMTQSINYPTGAAVFSSSQAETFAADMSRMAPTPSVTAYELTSVNEFVTIPLQAGYMLVNRKVGVQLNAGIASDLFLRNTLSDPAGRLSTNSQSAGEGSAYKTVNWSGLVGTELSYRVSKRYRISVIPGMRYSFDSILKSNVNGSITPLIWDVGFRFKYIF